MFFFRLTIYFWIDGTRISRFLFSISRIWRWQINCNQRSKFNIDQHGILASKFGDFKQLIALWSNFLYLSNLFDDLADWFRMIGIKKRNAPMLCTKNYNWVLITCHIYNKLCDPYTTIYVLPLISYFRVSKRKR